jgi:hypothetical protein
MLNKNMEYGVAEPRETFSSTDIHSIGKKAMLKKFTMLLAPFALASFGSLLTDSAVHAADWTGWQNCYFSTGLAPDYTPWRAYIDVRSDSAARAIRVQYGGERSNSERISAVTIQESRIINGANQALTPTVTINTANLTTWTSQLLTSLPWVSSAFRPRYINVTLFNADGRTCSSRSVF